MVIVYSLYSLILYISPLRKNKEKYKIINTTLLLGILKTHFGALILYFGRPRKAFCEKLVLILHPENEAFP